MVILLVAVAGLLPVVAAAGALSESRNGGKSADVVAAEAPAAANDGAQGWARGAVVTHTERFTLYLPIVFRGYLTAPYDMVDFLRGDDRLFEVQHSGGSQARHQTQVEGQAFFHTKGNEISAEWEELWADNVYIYRGTDTSPGNGQYYTLRDEGMYGSKWAPRHWDVGGIFYREPHVTFYRKQDCTVSTGGTQGSYLRFEAYHEAYRFESGIRLENVVELAWLLTPDGQPIERYFYAEFYGLVGWSSNNGDHSYISEIHAPGTRADNVREVISCLDRSPAIPAPFSGPLPYWPGEHRR